MDKLKLFCFHHAGGSARVFTPWKNYLNDFIELCPIELSGRGSRMNELFYQTFEEGLNDVFQVILKEVGDSPYALFGHSMGGMMVYELCHRIQKIDFRNPEHIYFSGMKAPGPSITAKKSEGRISDTWIEEKIFQLGGMPEELMHNKEILKLFMPILRSDFHMLETHQYNELDEKLNTDITILNGVSDDIVTNDSAKWQAVTSKKLNIYTFEGGHFFINDHVKMIVEIINQTLKGHENLIHA